MNDARWRTLARVLAVSPEYIEVHVPGGWDPVRVPAASVPDWLRSVQAGQHVICRARYGDEGDTVELADWESVLPIGLEPRPFGLAEYEALPEGKLELINGILYGDPATGEAMAAALLANLGLAEVVRMAPAELWHRALETLRTSARQYPGASAEPPIT